MMCWDSAGARRWVLAALLCCGSTTTPLVEANAPGRVEAMAEPGCRNTAPPIVAIANLPSPSYQPTVSWVLRSPASGVRVILYAVELDGPPTQLLQVEASAGFSFHEYVDHRRVRGERLYRLVVVDRLGREQVLANVLCALPSAGSHSTLASTPRHDPAMSPVAATVTGRWGTSGSWEGPLHSPGPVLPPPTPPPEGWITSGRTT